MRGDWNVHRQKMMATCSIIFLLIISFKWAVTLKLFSKTEGGLKRRVGHYRKIFGEISQFLYSNIQSSICLFLSIYFDILLYIHLFHTCEQFKERKIILFFKRPLDTRKNCPSWYQESAANKSREANNSAIICSNSSLSNHKFCSRKVLLDEAFALHFIHYTHESLLWIFLQFSLHCFKGYSIAEWRNFPFLTTLRQNKQWPIIFIIPISLRVTNTSFTTRSFSLVCSYQSLWSW